MQTVFTFKQYYMQMHLLYDRKTKELLLIPGLGIGIMGHVTVRFC